MPWGERGGLRGPPGRERSGGGAATGPTGCACRLRPGKQEGPPRAAASPLPYRPQVVAPKRAALAEANKKLDAANKKLSGGLVRGWCRGQMLRASEVPPEGKE